MRHVDDVVAWSLEVERLLHKLDDSVSVDQSPLGALMNMGGGQ